MNQPTLRASSFDADYHCPGRQNLLRYMRENNIPEEARSPELIAAALRGTQLHKAWETGATLDLDEGQLAAFELGKQLERTLVDEWMASIGIKTTMDLAPIMEQELYVNDPDTKAPLVSGHFDRLYVADTNDMRYGLLIDYKSGSGYYVPKAELSWQLRVYAVQASSEYNIHNLRVAYICPERFGNRMDFADLGPEQLVQVYDCIIDAARLTAEDGVYRNAGDHCEFCPAKGVCKEASSYALLPAIAGGPKSVAETVASMTPEELKQVWVKRGVVKGIFDSIEARLKAMSDEELKPMGLGRSKGKKLDSITDTVGAFNHLVNGGIEPIDVIDAMTFGKSNLTQFLMEHKGLKKKEAEAFIDGELDPFISRSTSAPSLIEL